MCYIGERFSQFFGDISYVSVFYTELFTSKGVQQIIINFKWVSCFFGVFLLGAQHANCFQIVLMLNTDNQ